MVEASTLIEHFPYLALFMLIILGGIGLPFPEDTTLILSGFLIAQGIIKPLPALLVIYPALLVADFSLYSLGKKYGRMLVEHKRFHWLISPDQLLRFEERFKRSGVLVVLFGRHLLGLRAQIFVVAGVMRMSPLKFIIADAATALLTIALMGGIGYAGGNSLQVLRKDVTRIEHIAIVVLVLLLAGWFIFKYLKSNKE